MKRTYRDYILDILSSVQQIGEFTEGYGLSFPDLIACGRLVVHEGGDNVHSNNL